MTIEIRMVVSNALRSTLDNSYGFVNILTNANIVDPLDLRTIKLDPSVVRFPLSLPISSLPEKVYFRHLNRFDSSSPFRSGSRIFGCVWNVRTTARSSLESF